MKSEPITARQIPTCDYKNNLQLALITKPAVLFSLLTSTDWDACDQMQIQNISQNKMIFDIKLKVQLDSDIHDSRNIRWTSVDYSKFWRNTDNEEKAARIYIDFMMKYQKNLSDHVCVPASL